ncbi:MAG: carbohydrate ABC transporter permease [Planctomycetes bacterium]|nr:carbohydrate ABC transporter permease [Planctomycetota bacterium]
MVVAGETQWLQARLLHRAEPGWYYVKQRLNTEEIDAPAEWDLLPPEQIHAETRLFWENYPLAIRRMGMADVWIPFLGPRRVPVFFIYLRNSLIVCGLGVLGTVISSALAAYSLAKIPWRGRGVLFAVTLATMMVPFPVLMVPTYALFKHLGWVGTLLPLWVPPALGTGFNIFLLRQFFLTIPRELSEAARIDGCSEFAIFWRIILPLSRPALAVVALFHFLYAWNDFLGPLVYLTRRETYTLSLGLQSYQSQQGGVDWTSLMAASTLVCLPIIVLFFFTQRTFIRGIATTGIKG